MKVRSAGVKGFVSAHASLAGLAAIAIGLADAVLIVTGRLGAAGQFQYVPASVWVLAPLCWAIAAVVLALPCFLLARRRGSIVTVLAMVALLAAVRLHGAPTIIALGGVAAVLVAFAAVWIAGHRWTSSPKPLAAAFTATALVALALAVILNGESDSKATATNPSPGPDVVVAFLDTVSYDSIFTHPAAVAPGLPFLSKLASEGTVFDRAYTTSPWTLPAHFSAVTGLAAHRLGVSFDAQHYDGHTTTLAERFRRRGYRTVAVISNSFLNRGSGFARGFDVFEHSSNALDVCRTAPGVVLDRWSPWFAASVCNWTASEVTSRAMGHLGDTSRPLFLLLNYMDAHDPYYVERNCSRPGERNPLPLDVRAADYRRRYHASHLSAIRCIDQQLGALSGKLAQRRRETVMVVLSDHGEQFGEHGLVRHGNSLYDRLLHVPFIVHAPRLAPRHIGHPVSIETLAGLVTDVADGKEVFPASGRVISWLSPPAAVGGGEQWSVIAGRWHLIQRADGQELYDLIADPGEENDLAASAAAGPTLRELSLDVERERRSRVEHPLEEFRSLGYIR